MSETNSSSDKIEEPKNIFKPVEVDLNGGSLSDRIITMILDGEKTMVSQSLILVPPFFFSGPCNVQEPAYTNNEITKCAD